MLAGGGEVIGVIPQALADREVAHLGVTDLRVVDSMHTRKAMMADLSDAFIAMPGGVGTFEEFFEAVTWTQLGVHRKPCGLLNAGGFYSPLAAFIDQAVTEGFIKPVHRAIVVVTTIRRDCWTSSRMSRCPDVPEVDPAGTKRSAPAEQTAVHRAIDHRNSSTACSTRMLLSISRPDIAQQVALDAAGWNRVLQGLRANVFSWDDCARQRLRGKEAFRPTPFLRPSATDSGFPY